MIPIINRVPKI